ncbi:MULTISPECIES: geranylgeranyl reductase family protein [Corynebacterium]|uniref:geranylgeranyl reductase family protein n=1 Tax=Corynebacterium TaxID=1716 RepID=UPI001F624F26|nr:MULTISPECIES: geranylgeranyl reductase family protein [Corynebacterium]MDK4314265.1 geranylgeranyl reductase family protein [Corynebacterium propinquum]WKS49297.1 geranylgeranyl reductase family protein [Corynebacterium propinquum]
MPMSLADDSPARSDSGSHTASSTSKPPKSEILADASSTGNDAVSCEIAVIGGGPAGATAAIYAARAGWDVVLVDQATFPRDKTCGDGLTPRAMAKLRELGLLDGVNPGYRNRGLKLHGFGGSVTAAWPNGHFGDVGTAWPRRELDNYLVQQAAAAGARVWTGYSGADVVVTNNSIETITVRRVGGQRAAERSASSGSQQPTNDQQPSASEITLRPGWTIVADGVRSTFGKKLGRTWHRSEVYGIAARSYCSSPYSDEPWMHSHVELTDEQGTVQPGYGWIFPLGDGTVNLGCGALSTDKRPAAINTKKLLEFYASQQRKAWGLGDPHDVASALLPMGGAVSNVAGANWMLIGDAAACVNPLNGEGIDYGLETAELAVGLLDSDVDLTLVWPEVLRAHFGEAFMWARTAARLLTYPQFLPVFGPLGLRGPAARYLMPAAARLMGNLVTDEDRDLISRLWKKAGKYAATVRADTPLWDSTV